MGSISFRSLSRVLLVLLVLPLIPATAQVRRHILFYPSPLERGEFEGAVGISLTALPQILVEEELRQSPLLQGRLRYGLPANFSLVGGLNTNILTTLASLEVEWNLEFDNFAFGISDRFAYWYGFARFEGFDINVTSWLNYPGFELGLRRGDVHFTTKAEMQLVTSLSVFTDGITTDSTSNYIAGYALGFTLEQPFWGDVWLELGLRLNYSKSLYQAWLAFNSFEKHLLFPEFSFSVIL